MRKRNFHFRDVYMALVFLTIGSLFLTYYSHDSKQALMSGFGILVKLEKQKRHIGKLVSRVEKLDKKTGIDKAFNYQQSQAYSTHTEILELTGALKGTDQKFIFNSLQGPHHKVMEEFNCLLSGTCLKAREGSINSSLEEYLESIERVIPFMEHVYSNQNLVLNNLHKVSFLSFSLLLIFLIIVLRSQSRLEDELVQKIEKTKRSQLTLSLALKAANIGIWDWDLKTGHLEWDDRMYSLFGLEPHSFKNTAEHFTSLLDKKDQDRVLKEFNLSLERDSLFSTQYNVPLPSGEKRVIDARGRALRGSDGEYERVIGVCAETSDFSKHQSEFKMLFERSPVAHFLMSTNHTIMQINEMTSKLFGYSAKEIIGKRIETLFPFADDASGFATVQEMLKSKELDLTAIKKSGETFPVSITAISIEKGGDLLVLISVFDLSFQKRADEKIQKAIDSAPIGLIMTNSEGKIELCNTWIEEYFGYHKNEILTQTIEKLIPDNFADWQLENFVKKSTYESKSIINNGRTIFARKKNGEKCPIELCLSPMKLKNESYVISSIIDITERKLAENKITKLNKELEAFSYSVSHDLRAPLRHMSGFIKLLAKRNDGKLDDQSVHYVETIKKASETMGNMIDDLLNFSRIGRASLKIEKVDLTNIVSDLAQELTPEYCTQEVEWEIKPTPPIECDRSLLRLALINLVSNALKFSNKNERPVIKFGIYKETNKRLTVMIEDNGVGFDMTYADKLFEVFQRLHSNEEFEGTGIGLANVKRIIERHNGKVWLHSEIGVGTKVFVRLPKKHNGVENGSTTSKNPFS